MRKIVNYWHTNLQWEYLKGRIHFGDLGVDVMIILRG
jgi:hypothetical protein